MARGSAGGSAVGDNSCCLARLGVLVALGVLCVLSTTSASAQRFLQVAQFSSDSSFGRGWDVAVDRGLVRSAPQRLEFGLPDGGVLAPVMRVFEDRGDGNVMWAGGYPELGYDNVLLTVQDGYVVGRLGLPEGGAYSIRAGIDGAGKLTVDRANSGAYCGGGVMPAGVGLRPGVPAQGIGGPPETVRSASNDDRFDILVLYTAAAAERIELAGWGPPNVAFQYVMDYFNLVLRNNRLPASANMVALLQAPAFLSGSEDPLPVVRESQEILDLRIKHNADHVHLFFSHTEFEYCGTAYQMAKRNASPEIFWPEGYGVTTVAGGCIDAVNSVAEGEHPNFVETFAHEVGHNLGADHNPEAGAQTPEQAVEPYAFGHIVFGLQPPAKSVMSGGFARVEPMFSNVRLQPRGIVLGVAGERENERALQRTIRIAVRLSDYLPGSEEPPPPSSGDRPAAPTDLRVIVTSNTSVKLTWVDRSNNEDGFEVQVRSGGGRWQTVLLTAADVESADVEGLGSGGRYDFRVRAFNGDGRAAGNVTTIVLPPADYTNCVPSAAQIVFGHGFTVTMCIEYQRDGKTIISDARNYGLESRESGILYFFDRDNAEVLVKVLDACAVNGYRWVFVAPVTDLAFNLYVDETATNTRWQHQNPKGGQTASTKSDVTAFPCGAARAAANGGDGGGTSTSTGAELVAAGFPATPAESPVLPTSRSAMGVARAIGAGQKSECEPQPVLSLLGGYTVNMCAEYLEDGESRQVEVKDYVLDSEQSGILYFFDRDNAEVLVKVLDGCDVNGYRWVFVAPVTDLAFNLSVESPGGEVWKHDNLLGRTAAAKSDTRAFACGNAQRWS